MSSASLIVLAYDWPGKDKGYRLALDSALRQYTRHFGRVHFIALVEDPIPSGTKEQYGEVQWKHITVKKRAKWQRFLKSLASSQPAVVMQYIPPDVRERLQQYIENLSAPDEEVAVVFEDVALAVLRPALRKVLPKAPFVLRSHNLLSESFEGFDQGGGLSQLAWNLELRKIRSLEKAACEHMDFLWAISQRDAETYRDVYQALCDGVVGLSLDAGRYADVSLGALTTVTCIGSADLRKAHGLSLFIKHCWPLVQSRVAEARLVLGGRFTERFDAPEQGVEGRGYVENDRSLLGEGLLSVNPQERGSGVNLKSIIAMLAGKALVSTAKGAEGIGGTPGVHYLVAENKEEMADHLVHLMRHPDEATGMGAQARAFARAHYGEGATYQAAQPLLEALEQRALQSTSALAR